MARTMSPCAGPKESRTNSLGRAKADCHTCSRTRQQCDRQRPRCGTCNNSGRVCGGYTLDLTWKAVTGGIETSISSPTQSSPDLSKSNTPRLANAQQPVSSPGREFKFRVGKPKRPRKRPSENSSTTKGTAEPTFPRKITIASTLNPETNVFPPSPQHPTQYTGNSSYKEGTKRHNVGGGGGKVSHDPSDTSEEDVESLESNEGAQISPVPSRSLIRHHSSTFEIPPGMLFSSVADKYKGVLQMYDQEFCTRPLTKDFAFNPFRCREETSDGTNFLFHAILALSSHHLARTQGDVHLKTESLNHKSTAIKLYSEALLQPDIQHLALLDTLLILITLEAAQSALSTWKVHLVGAYNLIEAAGGVSVLVTPRLRSQFGMLQWWDLTIALMSRQNPVFDEAYLNAIFSSGSDDSQLFFDLSGCPAVFAKFMTRLARTAAKFEATQFFAWARFDDSPVDELERCLKSWSNPYGNTCHNIKIEEDPQVTRDSFHCVEAWRHALLIYILQVFRRDQREDNAKTTAYFARLILDHTRCIRRSSVTQKQVLLPVFLAGSEVLDANGYYMFQNVADLLGSVWKDRKQHAEQPYWWGMTVDRYTQTAAGSMTTQFLLG